MDNQVLLLLISYYYVSLENDKKAAVQAVKNHYGYTDLDYDIVILSLAKDGIQKKAMVKVTSRIDNISWNIICSKINDSVWQRDAEQFVIDSRELDEIGFALKGLASGVRIGNDVYVNKSEVARCRELLKRYNLKNPNSKLRGI